MKKQFSLNRTWSKAYGFLTANLFICMVLMVYVTANSSSLPHPYIWASFILLLIVFLLFFIPFVASLTVKGMDIDDEYLTLHFFFFKSLKYNFNEIRYYATAANGSMRAGYNHSVILEFTDGKRFQVAYPMIEDYKSFLEFMRSSDLEFYGYIGQNNWKRKGKPLSKKWVVARYETDLEKNMGKTTGVFILYFYGIIALAMSLAMLRYLILF